jgi:hypothetical protein
MLYDLDPVPEDNTRKPEVKGYVDVKKQAAKLGHLNPATRVCLPHLLNQYFISPDMVIISVQCGWIMYIRSSICLWLSFAPAVGIDMGLGLLRVSMLL